MTGFDGYRLIMHVDHARRIWPPRFAHCHTASRQLVAPRNRVPVSRVGHGIASATTDLEQKLEVMMLTSIGFGTPGWSS